MEPIRDVARALAKSGSLEICQRGATVDDLDDIKGPIRLRRPQA